MDTIIHHPSCIYRRVDDQAFLTHTQEEAQTAYRIFRTVTETAGCPVQWDKSIIATRLFKFDGYMFDLIRQRVGIPTEKRTYMATTIHRLLRHARKRMQKIPGPPRMDDYHPHPTAHLYSGLPQSMDERSSRFMSQPIATSNW